MLSYGTTLFKRGLQGRSGELQQIINPISSPAAFLLIKVTLNLVSKSGSHGSPFTEPQCLGWGGTSGNAVPVGKLQSQLEGTISSLRFHRSKPLPQRISASGGFCSRFHMCENFIWQLQQLAVWVSRVDKNVSVLTCDSVVPYFRLTMHLYMGISLTPLSKNARVPLWLQLSSAEPAHYQAIALTNYQAIALTSLFVHL